MTANTIQTFLKPGKWLHESGGPRYTRLSRRIQEIIEKGILKESSPLPAEREIAGLTGFSRVTVRRAMQELVDQGLIVQRQGLGSFVSDGTPRVKQSLSRLTSFTEDMTRRGLASSSSWLEREIAVPTLDEIMNLALASGESVARISRLRCASGKPMAIERASLPVDILPDPNQIKTSLYEFLESSSNRPVRALQRISAARIEDADANLLGLEDDAVGLHIVRTSFLPNRRVIEFTRSVYRGDAYDFIVELH